MAPEGGLTIDDIHFPQGEILSVLTYTIHRDKHAWGDDVGVFRPERWFKRDHAMIQKAFNPFSFGPRRASSALTALQRTDASCLIRACVGRNLASMELLIIVSLILQRYHFVLCTRFSHGTACHPRRLPSQAVECHV